MKRIGLFVCFAIMMANIVSAQTLKKYEGAMKLPSDLELLVKLYQRSLSDVNSQGSYQYYEDINGERIKHGTFSFVSKSIGYPKLVIKGNYVDGQKDGAWTAGLVNDKNEMVLPHLGQDYCGCIVINYSRDSICGDYDYIYGSNGGIYMVSASGTITNGYVHGKVSLTKIKTTSLTDNTLADECEMTGEIGADGMPVGIWTVTDKGGIEKVQRRFFHKGILVAIDELDNSTGERALCYCAFEGLKKAPKMEEIKDSIVGLDSYIVYNGQAAIKVKDDNSINYNSNLGRYSMGNNITSDVVPKGIKQLSESVTQQTEMWNYVYSEKKAKEIQDIRRKERERFVQDSIREAKLLHEQKLRESNNRFKEELIKYKQTEPVKKIKKSSVEGNEILFQTKDQVFRGEFRKEYVKNDIGEPFDFDDHINSSDLRYCFITTVLFNKSGDIVLIRFKKHRNDGTFVGFVVYLIDKRNGKAEVYEVTKSALKGLPIEW